MDNLNYTIKTYEAVLIPTEDNKAKIWLRNCAWAIIGIIIISSFVLDINMFEEISWTARIFLITVAIGFGFFGEKKEYVPSPMELQFYDDYLVLYLPKRYYSRRITRKQINTMKYSEISKCVLKNKSNRIQIYGNGNSIWYNYKKDGSISSKPTEERRFTEGMIYFNIQFASEIDFKEEIESHSPLKVIVENS